jgi:hypothetical protein
MNKNIQNHVTRREMPAMDLHLVEDTCAETSCGITIMVDKDLKEQGRKSRCMPCILRDKISRGEFRK